MNNYINCIKHYSKNNYETITREPGGYLKYPFIVPGKSYAKQLWDWDSWLTDVAIRQIMNDNNINDKSFFKYEKGCILNFFDYVDENGRMPIAITSDKVTTMLSVTNNMHKPCLAQHLAFIMQQTDNKFDWFEDKFDKLELFVNCYMTQQKHSETGLYLWLDDLAIGVDNDPCTFYRPEKSSASIYLNCLMYKELLAMVYICGVIGKPSDKYKKAADELKCAVNEYLWDERNGFYYSADLNLLPINPN